MIKQIQSTLRATLSHRITQTFKISSWITVNGAGSIFFISGLRYMQKKNHCIRIFKLHYSSLNQLKENDYLVKIIFAKHLKVWILQSSWKSLPSWISLHETIQDIFTLLHCVLSSAIIIYYMAQGQTYQIPNKNWTNNVLLI